MAQPKGERYGLTVSEAPYRSGGRIPIYVPSPDRPVDVVILGEGILGVEMHWVDGRTRPCLALSGYCQHCDGWGPPDRWKGFIVAFDWQKGRNVLTECTGESANKIQAAGKVHGRLRGARLQMRRSGRARNSVVIVTVTPRFWVGEQVPPAFDGIDALVRIWNLAEVPKDRARNVVCDPLTDGL